MDSKNIIIIVLVALIIACVGVLCFSMFNTGNEDVVVNNTTVVNDTNDTVNATLTSSSNSNSGHSSSSSSSGGWNEEQDLSELYGDGERHTVTIHHDGRGGISWNDDLGHHTGREGDIQSW